MTIKQQINELITTAMKHKAKTTLSVLRMMKDTIEKKEKDLLRELSETEAIQALQTFKKQSEESLEYAVKANDTINYDKFTHEIEVVNAVLPKQMSVEELINVVKEVIKSIDIPNIGNVIKAVKERVEGRADNKTISEIVKKELQ
jgi:hypothetical protein